MTITVRKLIVRLRMWYARIRGHKEHRWDYEPSEWYMGKHNKKNKEKKIMFETKVKEQQVKRYIVMKRYNGNDYFYSERGFSDINDADSYAELLRKQEPDYKWFLFEQSKQYGNGEDKDA